jgi:hypothetical protein
MEEITAGLQRILVRRPNCSKSGSLNLPQETYQPTARHDLSPFLEYLACMTKVVASQCAWTPLTAPAAVGTQSGCGRTSGRDARTRRAADTRNQTGRARPAGHRSLIPSPLVPVPSPGSATKTQSKSGHAKGTAPPNSVPLPPPPPSAGRNPLPSSDRSCRFHGRDGGGRQRGRPLGLPRLGRPRHLLLHLPAPRRPRRPRPRRRRLALLAPIRFAPHPNRPARLSPTLVSSPCPSSGCVIGLAAELHASVMEYFPIPMQ